MTQNGAVLYYVHDPMCSWCWAYRPRMIELQSSLPDGVAWHSVLGGLAPDSNQPMPEGTRQMVQSHWRKIQASTATEFNFDFWIKCQPRRDTYKSCRAVIAASNQQAGEEMVEAIQKAYYLRAMNPSELETLAELARELGLDRKLFDKDLVSLQTEKKLQNEFLLRSRLGVRSFPSLVLGYDSSFTPINHDYKNVLPTLMEIRACVSSVTS